MDTTAAVILFAAITVYAVFGGADFGAGFWDLVAGGAKRGERPREVIDHSIAPVWEANHVWLIFVFVLLWTCFPEAYASITLTMFVPLTLAALGIVLRGASFAFRKSVFRTRDRRNFGAAFALSSVLVPYCFGAVVGGIASGRVPAGGKAGDPWDSWVNPTSVTVGLLTVSLDAYLAAFFLVRDAGRLSDEAMVAYFRRRATGAAVVAGAVSLAGIFVLSNDAEYLFDGLTSQALPLVILSVALGLGAFAPAHPAGPARSPAGCRGSGRQRGPGVGRGPVGLPAARVADGLGRQRRPRGPSRRCWSPPGSRCCSSYRPSRCCTSSTRRACCPRRACRSPWGRRPGNRDERWVTGRRRVGRDGHHPLWVMPLRGCATTFERWLPTSTTTSSSSAPERVVAPSRTGWRRRASGS